MKTTQQYITPEVEIVEMNVEQGFIGTGEGNIDDTTGGGEPTPED